MTSQTIMQLVAVVVGGLIAITGGFLSTTVLERRRLRQESRNLAFAFRGEITAILELIRERNYLERFQQVIEQIEQSGESFYMPFHIRFKYDLVYSSNVSKIGLLKEPLHEQIPLFYTRLTSILEEMVNLGEGVYSQLEQEILLRIYRDTRRAIQLTVTQGEEILASITDLYSDS